MNIRTKLIAWLGFSTAIVLIITTFALVRIIGKETTELINSELESNMQATTSIVNTAINNSVKSYLRAIADNGRSICQMYYEKELSGELTHEQAWRSARNLIVNPIYGKVGETGYLAGVSTKGILAMHPLSEGVDASGYEFMQQAMLIKNGYLEYNWKNKDETVERAKAGYLSYFEPWDIMIWASSYKEELLGLIKPEDFRDEVLSIKIGDTGYPYIIDMSGTLVIHPSLEGKNLYNTPDANGLYFIKEMIDDEDGQGYTEYSWQNPNDLKPRDKFQKYERLDDYGWIVAISSYKAEFNSYQNNIITILILGVLISLIVIILAVILISKKMSGSIHKIQSIIGNLENGDFSNQYTIHGSDEFAQMVSSSNNMSSGLNQSVNQIKDVVKINRFLSDDLASHSTEVSATVTEMSASMDTMKSGLTNINNQLQQSDDGLQTIQTNVGKVVVLIDEQGQSVNESSSAIEQMLSSITSIEKMTEEKMTVTNMLTSLAKKGETNMLATVTSINEIEEYTVSILDLINIINNVAAQTNLLAMNAAIEAAHAGQYGRGFSVVADEIRKLAETAAQNSKNVSISLKSMTEKIKTASNQSVETNNTFKEIITGIGDVSTGMQETLGGLKEMATGSQQITLSMNTLHQMTGNVREAGDLMGQGIEEIYNAQVEVNSMMGNYLNTISEVAEGSNEISKAMVQLSELSTKNQEAIERLESSIAKFKTTDVN